MSAAEFARWSVYLGEEQIGPAFDRWRHAQLRAASLNAGRAAPLGGGLFETADLVGSDPWTDTEEAPEASNEPSFADIQAQAERMSANARRR